MIKIEKEYRKTYGEIPSSYNERISTLLFDFKPRKNQEIYQMIQQILAIKWDNYDCVIYLLPKGSQRPRRRKDRETFYVQGASDNIKIFRRFLIKNPHKMICTPIIFNCDIYLPIPSSMSSAEKIIAEMGYIRPISKPDFDNVAKTYSDMLTGSLIYDDDQIIESKIRKYYSIKPRIELHLKYMADFDSCFNKRKIIKRIEKSKKGMIEK